MEKDAFQTYILPFMPQAQRNKLAKGLIADIAVKDERCVFYLTKLYVYEGYYVLTKYRSQTFIRSRELVAGQTLWLRWINGYMEFKVEGLSCGFKDVRNGSLLSKAKNPIGIN
ncbi:hypothetical protein Dimus_004688 [Dionaea muscipula]